jgi:hypothetical protein
MKMVAALPYSQKPYLREEQAQIKLTSAGRIGARVALETEPTSAEDTMVAARRFSGGALGILQISWASRSEVEGKVTLALS